MRLDFRRVTSPFGAAAASCVVGALALTVAACGSSSPSAASAGSKHTASMHKHAMMHQHPMMHEMTIGTDCGMLPVSGMGSMHGMGSEPVATAASHNPMLTTLATELGKAGLTGTLNSAHAITVFAPDNAAFKKLSSHAMTMMSSTAELAKILKYHVVNGTITPAELAHAMTLTSLEGGGLRTSKMGSTYEVNGAAITCGNLHTANATVYIINAVLMPMH